MLFITAFPFSAFAEGEEPPHQHEMSHFERVEPTCEEDGKAEYYFCSGCEKYFTDEEGANEVSEKELVLPKTEHIIELVEAVPATCTADGYHAYFKCAACGKLFKDSEAEKETALENELVPMHDHTLAFINSVTRTFNIDGYTEGAYCSECGCTIVPWKLLARYGVPKLTKAKKGKASLTAVWKTVDDVDGYVVQVSLKKSFKGKKSYTVKNAASKDKTVKSLKRKKKYYVRVRAYKIINGEKRYSKWSNVKSVKTK